MSLLSFFAHQRSHWQRQAADQPAAYVAGGLAALNQAESAFKATTLHNAQQQATTTQHELKEVSYQLTRARQKISRLEASLAAMTQQAADAPRWHQRRAYRARKALRKIAEAANHAVMRPETKLRHIQAATAAFFAHTEDEEHAHDFPDLAAADLPLE